LINSILPVKASVNIMTLFPQFPFRNFCRVLPPSYCDNCHRIWS